MFNLTEKCLWRKTKFGTLAPVFHLQTHKRGNQAERLFRCPKAFRRIFSRSEKLDEMFTVCIDFAFICDALMDVSTPQFCGHYAARTCSRGMPRSSKTRMMVSSMRLLGQLAPAVMPMMI